MDLDRLVTICMWFFMYVIILTANSQRSRSEKHLPMLSKRPLMLVSTLNGSLISVDRNTGSVLWTLQADPVLNVEHGGTSEDLLFLPNPKDGSVYGFDREGNKFERLPLTIPELVHISPTQSSDGLLYTARKSDMWMVLDPETGRKLHSFTSDGTWSTCPSTEDHEEQSLLYLGRTAYTVSVFDAKTSQKRWNATFLEYLSHSYDDHTYQDRLHFCSSSDGSVLSVDALTGRSVWRNSYGSPVVAVYSWEGADLRRIPITSVAVEAFDDFTGSLQVTNGDILLPSLFIGVVGGQLYALDSLAVELNIIFEPDALHSTVPLLEGPEEEKNEVKSESVIGHFCLPEESKEVFLPLSKQVTQDWYFRLWHQYGVPTNHRSTFSNPLKVTKGRVTNEDTAEESFASSSILTFAASISASMLGAFIVMKFCGTQNQNYKIKDVSLNETSYEVVDQSNDSSASGHRHITTVEADTGLVNVGKLSFSVQDIIGHGSQGTVVYSGMFEKRPVAVKRLLPECFAVADREVELLSQSDHHPNVVRYFCMENDPIFRYIALELCQATLHEYVEDPHFDRLDVEPITLLKQATNGLAHLHSLGIVHQDIKPRNVLLSVSVHGMRALISDFGLCRKLSVGKASLTAASGLAGTEGWLAPEMMTKKQSVTRAVDIFSMGCVAYFALTANHPFGRPLHRQANIDCGHFILSALTGTDKYVAENLITTMIGNNSVLRPTVKEVLSHCLFWSNEKRLSFFQDVSNRIEKEPLNSRIVQSLECNSVHVVRGDWMKIVGEELRGDLCRFRSYHGNSIRDLIRAIRNKSHHYRELPDYVKHSLGSIPDKFVEYFTSRFPLLLINTYKQMDSYKLEPVFQSYYK